MEIKKLIVGATALFSFNLASANDLICALQVSVQNKTAYDNCLDSADLEEDEQACEKDYIKAKSKFIKFEMSESDILNMNPVYISIDLEPTNPEDPTMSYKYAATGMQDYDTGEGVFSSEQGVTMVMVSRADSDLVSDQIAATLTILDGNNVGSHGDGKSLKPIGLEENQLKVDHVFECAVKKEAPVADRGPEPVNDPAHFE